MNEILGRSGWAPIIFGCQAPDTGNAEILAHYGTAEQKEKYLQPLLDGEMFSCYSMTEPQARRRSRPSSRRRAVRDGDEWVINGWKFFSSNAATPSFLIVMAFTDPDVGPYKGMSMFIVPTDTPGVEIVRNIGLVGEPVGRGLARAHPLRRRARPGREPARRRGRGVRGRADRASAAVASTTRCARSASRNGRFDMMCERALSRHTKGDAAGREAGGAGRIADSYIQLQQFRLLVLYTAWLIDQYHDYLRVRKDIATIKVAHADGDGGHRHGAAIQIHGALGMTSDMPLGRMLDRRHGARPRRRPDRGAQGHGRAPAAASVQAGRRAVADDVSAPAPKAAREKLALLVDLEAAEL